MAKEDLYGELGVDADATPDEIKAAHRRAVRQHHPDAGGEPDRFLAIQRAYNVLSDASKREEYDRTGRVNEHDAEALLRAQAKNVVAGLFLALVDTADVIHNDVVGLMRERVTEAIAGIEAQIDATRGKQARLREMKIRLRRLVGEGVDELGALAEANAANEEARITALEDALKINRAAIALLEEYRYDYTPRRTQWVSMGPSGQRPPWGVDPLV